MAKKATEKKEAEKGKDVEVKISATEEKAAVEAVPAEKTAEKEAVVETAVKETAVKEGKKRGRKPGSKNAVKTINKDKEVKKAEKQAEKQEEVYLQFAGEEIAIEEVMDKARAAYVAEGHRASSIKSLRLYIKPEERKAYYVINEKAAGSIAL